jgi:superfamily II DNA/RNA helicase
MQENKISVKTILSNLEIDTLNEMQVASRDAFRKHDNLVLLSDTGSGKTIAFLLPLLDLLDVKKPGTQALIIVPSRELALQIEQVFKSMGTGYKVSCCYGGHLRETEENNLIEAPLLIIGTPGRLADHLRRGNINPAGIQTLVLDEFDKSLELGFEEGMSYIIGSLTSLQKKILTSATGTLEIPSFIELVEPMQLNYLSGKIAASLSMQTVHSEEKDKTGTLFKLLCFLGDRSAIVFCNHRESVERTSRILKEKGIINVFYHGALEQPERDMALCKFRNGSADVLVTTDLASRGLDIPNIRYIIHFHLPISEEAFIHRNGRTARMDASGTAILILSAEERLPPYITGETREIILPENPVVPDKPKWTTLFIAAGKKDKVNKVDIVGFLSNQGQLKKEDIGLIEVKDFFSFVAVRKSRVGLALESIKGKKIKNKKVKIDLAK